MSRRNSSLLDDVVAAPWPAGVVLAAISYIGFKFLLPMVATENPFLKGILSTLPSLAPILAIMFLVCAALSAFISWRKGQLFNSQTGMNSIRLIGWREFEELVGEAYRRKGFMVKETGGDGADGGVDLEITKDGKTFFVQCKHWRDTQVGVKIVRELYGVVAARGAAGGIVISSGIFTKDAKDFASGKQLELVDGNGLVRMIAEARKANGPVLEKVAGEAASIKCPKCGSSLVLRTAKKGPSSGSKFWGCSAFPKCKYTRGYDG
jgi:restriction system protein